MSVIEIKAQGQRELSVMEKINQKSTVYLCVDCELCPCLCTPDIRAARRYAAEHFCTISEYPPGTYTEDI